MAKTREDYEAAGRRLAQQVNDPELMEDEPLIGRGPSWQARSYWEAFDAEIERLKDSALAQAEKPRDEASGAIGGVALLRPSTTVLLDFVESQGIEYWPQAAAEHYRLLIEQAQACREPRRGRRLWLAVKRISDRHSTIPR